MPTTSAPATALLPPNYVWRSYLGGHALRCFRGGPERPDDHFPEDWLASTVKARNGSNSQGQHEGLSRLSSLESECLLATALEAEPEFWFGRRDARNRNASGTGVLWKLLDSSVRLQFQAHPDARFASQHLNSSAGKTECWYILSTRGDACVYLGFQRPPTRETWRCMIEEQNVDEMLKCFEPITVKAGDCFVVPAGTTHAIGAGVFMMELQEPTDWVVRCERVNAGLVLPPDACFMGLSLEQCLDVFDYRACSLEHVHERFRQAPRPLHNSAAFRHEEIIAPSWHNFFRLERLRGKGNADWHGGELMLVVALQGKGTLVAGDSELELCAGQTWLLPGAITEWKWAARDGDWELLLAKLPKA